VQLGTDMLFEMIPACLEFFGYGTVTHDELRAVSQIEYRSVSDEETSLQRWRRYASAMIALTSARVRNASRIASGRRVSHS
jgi:hypothetical protein